MSNPRTNPFGSAVWRVEILAGKPIDESHSPFVTLASEVSVTIGDEDSAGHALVYGPVALHGDTAMIYLKGYAGPPPPDALEVSGYQFLRSLSHPIVEFDQWGYIRIQGFELGDDGSLTFAVWEVQPYEFPPDAQEGPLDE